MKLPEPYQKQILNQLRELRDGGERRGYIELAPGIGKFEIIAFDTIQTEYEKILVLSDREEVLSQAREQFHAVYGQIDGKPSVKTETLTPGKSLRKWQDRVVDKAKIVFATIDQVKGATAPLRSNQKISRDHFDYVILDELHSESMSFIDLKYFSPKFRLGTVTIPRVEEARESAVANLLNKPYPDIRYSLEEAVEDEIIGENALEHKYKEFGKPDELETILEREFVDYE